jgi:uncharacterized membrane protein YhfC
VLIAAYSTSILGMIGLPIVLAFYLTRKFKLSWRLFLAGGTTFIGSQVLHIPLLSALTALFNNGALPAVPGAWRTLFNAVLLGLLAGLFEETARWILYKYILKNAKTWQEGVLVGVGHGGAEAIILGIITLGTIGSMITMRNADPSAFGVPTGQVELARQQIAAFWSSPAYMGLLPFVERVSAISLHLSLSVMVLYSVVYRKPIWFWIALLWHAFVDGLTVYLLPSVGAVGIEGIVGLCAAISLVILFTMRAFFIESDGRDNLVTVEAA